MMKRIFITLLLLLSQLYVCAGDVLLRFGAISDNHLDRRAPDSWERTRLAFEFFKKQKVDFFVDAGDVTDTYQVDMFKLWRKMYLEVFSDESSRPDFLMIPAGHDKSGAESTAAGYAEFVKQTGSGAVNPVKVVKGYHFVSLAQWQSVDILKKNLDAAVAGSKPGQPIFVVTHVPPKNTTGGSSSKAGGDEKVRKLLDKYPQVITLSGHTHNRLLDERSIWQGTFTAVNLGTLAYCGNGGIANPTDRPKSHDASIWEVYADKVIVRRFNVRTGTELFPERRWTVPLPFKAESAPYSAKSRKNFPVAEFGADAKINFTPEFAAPHRWGKLLIPALKKNPFALNSYLVKVEKKSASGGFEHYGMLSFTRTVMPDAVSGEVFTFPAGYLDGNSSYRVTVTPVSFFDRSGRAITGGFHVGVVPWREVAARHEAVWQPWKSSKVLPVAGDGFVCVEGDVRYRLPFQAVETTRKLKLKSVAVSMDIECIGKGTPAMLRISNDRNRIITLNTGSYRKTAQKQRYSFIFQPDKKSKQFFLLIRRGSAAKYRISNVRTFVY